MTDDSAREKAEHRIERASEVYEGHGRVFKVVWIAVGVIVVVAGLAMSVLPGPATVVIPIGLAMLAVVFGWARRVLLGGIGRGSDAVRAFRDTSTPVQVLTILAVLSLVAAVTAWLLL